MDNKVLLAKSITLLYRESLLENQTENSIELVRTVLGDIKVSESSIGISSERELVTGLKGTILDMCNNPPDEPYNVSDLLQRIKINTGHDEKLYEAIRSSLEADMSEGSLKGSIVGIRKNINNHYRQVQIADTLRKASSKFTYEPESIKDVSQFINELIGQLEGLTISSTAKDPAMMGSLDLSDEEALKAVFSTLKETGGEGRVYRLGWDGMTDMCQGGLRAGEFIVIGALQHKYKTGFSMSLFDQIARYNTPKTKDASKKPLLYRISFEDDLTSNLQFMYQRLKYNETREYVDLAGVSSEEMAAYVKSVMGKTGFHLKMERYDPTQWTYKSIFNRILELEAQGYNIEVLSLDYLGLIPTTGCSQGPAGTDMRDLMRRVRNFCSSRGIVCVTPHQLSTEAKALLRNGTPDIQFVKEITEKGYHAGSKQLDQEMDLELYIHKFKHGNKYYLAVQRGKHRLPTIISDELKHFFLEFPKGMPIPDSLEGEPVIRRLTAGASNADNDLFGL